MSLGDAGISTSLSFILLGLALVIGYVLLRWQTARAGRRGPRRDPRREKLERELQRELDALRAREDEQDASNPRG